MTIQEIAPREVMRQRESGKVLPIIDVRSPGEFRARHITGAINIPLDQLSAQKVAQVSSGASELLVVCEGGTRAKKGCELLTQAGIHHVTSILGGTRAWAAEGLPVELSKGPISLERQVRIVAGSLVILGIFLASLGNPNWIWLSAFVGAGLVFAGATDTCAMGMLLAKMPWNSRKHCAANKSNS